MPLTAHTTITDASIAPNAAATSPLMHSFRDNIEHVRDWLGGSFIAGAAEDHNHDGVNSAVVSVSTHLMPGASFEGINGADPSGWTKTVYAGGTVALTTAAHTEGDSCLAITSTVALNGGGNALQDSYEPVCNSRYYAPAILYFATVANVPSKIVVEWYDSDQVKISESTLTDLADTPIAATEYTGGPVQAPATAHYARAKVELPAAGAAFGTVYFDAGKMFEAVITSSIVDNSITGPKISDTIIADGSQSVGAGVSYTPTAKRGPFTAVATAPGHLELYVASAWRTPTNGFVMGYCVWDGANQRYKSHGSYSSTIYWQEM